jgi:hypothetical protein
VAPTLNTAPLPKPMEMPGKLPESPGK